MNVAFKLISGLVLLLVMLGGPLFLAAGTFDYWEGWLFFAVFYISMVLNTLNVMMNDPELLKRRMKAGPTAEKRGAQRVIMFCIIVLYLAMFAVSGLDHRFGWSHVPRTIVILGDVMIVFSFIIFDWVMRENTFAAATIDTFAGQKVISTGPYRLIRHPMYFGGMFVMLGIPLALGSLWALSVAAISLPVLMWRIADEEKLLTEQLEGYKEYCSEVKCRLIPGLY